MIGFYPCGVLITYPYKVTRWVLVHAHQGCWRANQGENLEELLCVMVAWMGRRRCLPAQ